MVIRILCNVINMLAYYNIIQYILYTNIYVINMHMCMHDIVHVFTYISCVHFGAGVCVYMHCVHTHSHSVAENVYVLIK